MKKRKTRFRKKRTALLIGSSMMAGQLSGCSYGVQLLNQTFVVELGTDVYGNPSLYVKDPSQFNTSSMKIEPRNSQITVSDNRFVTQGQDYLGVGEYNFVLLDNKDEIPFVIKVKDTQPPVCTNIPASIQASVGQKIDWSAIYQATDLSGVYYDAPWDITDSAGQKRVQVKVYDRFGNSVTQDLTVEVI